MIVKCHLCGAPVGSVRLWRASTGKYICENAYKCEQSQEVNNAEQRYKHREDDGMEPAMRGRPEVQHPRG